MVVAVACAQGDTAVAVLFFFLFFHLCVCIKELNTNKIINKMRWRKNTHAHTENSLLLHFLAKKCNVAMAAI